MACPSHLRSKSHPARSDLRSFFYARDWDHKIRLVREYLYNCFSWSRIAKLDFLKCIGKLPKTSHLKMSAAVCFCELTSFGAATTVWLLNDLVALTPRVSEGIQKWRFCHRLLNYRGLHCVASFVLGWSEFSSCHFTRIRCSSLKFRSLASKRFSRVRFGPSWLELRFPRHVHILRHLDHTSLARRFILRAPTNLFRPARSPRVTPGLPQIEIYPEFCVPTFCAIWPFSAWTLLPKLWVFRSEFFLICVAEPAFVSTFAIACFSEFLRLALSVCGRPPRAVAWEQSLFCSKFACVALQCHSCALAGPIKSFAWWACL